MFQFGTDRVVEFLQKDFPFIRCVSARICPYLPVSLGVPLGAAMRASDERLLSRVADNAAVVAPQHRQRPAPRADADHLAHRQPGQDVQGGWSDSPPAALLPPLCRHAHLVDVIGLPAQNRGCGMMVTVRSVLRLPVDPAPERHRRPRIEPEPTGFGRGHDQDEICACFEVKSLAFVLPTLGLLATFRNFTCRGWGAASEQRVAYQVWQNEL